MGAIDNAFAVVSATLTGLLLQWAGRTYCVNPDRMRWPIYWGLTVSWLAYALSIYTTYVYTTYSHEAFGWGNMFALVWFNCLLYCSSLMAVEVTLYIYNIVFFGPVSSLAFAARALLEGLGYVIGYVINPYLTNRLGREMWPVILLGCTVPAGLAFHFGFHLPKYYLHFDELLEMFSAQPHKYTAEALGIANRELDAEAEEMSISALSHHSTESETEITEDIYLAATSLPPAATHRTTSVQVYV